MKALVRFIPNLLTLANLFCGCLGILFVFEGNLKGAAYLIILAAVFDFLDGFAARLLNSFSDVGKDLDSLADVVTFGVLPSFILFHLMKSEFQGSGFEWFSYFAFLTALLSALRLAKFNNDTRQTDQFIGVPTPANAMVIASLPHITDRFWPDKIFVDDPWFLLGFTLVTSFLLIAPLPLLALKFKDFGWAGNWHRYLLIAASVLLLIFYHWLAVPLIMLIYLLLSLWQSMKPSP